MQGVAIGSMTGEDRAGQSVWMVRRNDLAADGLVADGLIFEIEQECSGLAMVFLLPGQYPPVFAQMRKNTKSG